MNERNEWQFITSTAKRDDWRWQQVNRHGEVVRRSARTFAFLLDCIADAKRHGYAPAAKASRAKARKQA